MLGTKLQVPATRRPLVARPRLTELVRSGASELPRLVLVSAPAGFGKTTLLSQCSHPPNLAGRLHAWRGSHSTRETTTSVGSWPISSERWRPAGWTSTLAGPVADQSQLHGLLAGLRDIGATLLSIQPIDQPDPDNRSPPFLGQAGRGPSQAARKGETT